MQPEHFPDIHLSYCTNIHPGDSWKEIYGQLKQYLPDIKKRVSPDASFGIGLRLSFKAARELEKPEVLQEFGNWLKHEGLYVFTINGFVYGSFHNTRVKDNVYRPDWETQERYQFTSSMIRILAALTEPGGEGSISTSPVSYKHWGRNAAEKKALTKTCCSQLVRLAREMNEIYKNEKKLIHINIEPEPDCTLETTEETIQFFLETLMPAGIESLTENNFLTREEAGEIIKNHIRICFDTCHVALEYEDPKESILAFENAGIRIGKAQLSSALKVTLGNSKKEREAIRKRLKQFVEPVYLHQVLARKRDGSIEQFRDLDAALIHINDPESLEWRVHFHVPVFLQTYGMLSSTQNDTLKSLHTLLERRSCAHFEIETYTWDVLPGDLKLDLAKSIERELVWALDKISNYLKSNSHA